MADVLIDHESAKSLFGISDTEKRILRDQVISDDRPGTVLRDFEVLLAFIGDDGLKTTGKYYLLPQSRLEELNQRMSRPVPHRLTRPQQRSLPHTHGLYLLLRASGLGIGVGQPPHGRLMLDPETLALWPDLNPTERYFTLLESWLVHGSPQIHGEPGGRPSGCLNDLLWVAPMVDQRKTPVPYEHILAFGAMRFMAVALMELFGWVRLDYRTPAPGEGVKLARIEWLPIGDAMVSALTAYNLSGAWPGYYEGRPGESGALKAVFGPYFPEWQRTLVPAEPPFREGTYTFRVSLGSVWRRIDAPADSMLDDLAMTILDAFRFDDDHLYCFELTDRRGRNLRITGPYQQDAPANTDKVALGNLPLPEGGTMTFLLDYGDSGRFSVKLEQVGQKSKLSRPRITAWVGRAPNQYPSEGDWW